MKLRAGLLAASLLLLLQGCSDSKKTTQATHTETQIEQANAMVARQNISYSLVDTNLITYQVDKGDNGSYNIKGQENKIVLLDFFTTWCPSCKAVAPHISNLKKKYPNDLLVLGVLLEDGKNKAYVDEFVNTFNAHYPISISKDNRRFAMDIYAAVQAPRSMPIPLLVILKNGKYVNHYIGSVPEEMIESDIKRALGQ